MYGNVFKPVLDFFVALVGLILISPIFVTIVIILIIANNGKPFFFQTRAGKHGKAFKIIKLKSMNDKKDENGEFLPFDQRLTKIGAFVRKYSLDEMPQLFNILKGDMSFVGPRPLHMEYLPLYDKEQARRHDVIGGISGWAQVNGRNSITWEQKFEHDVWYVDNQSFLVDIKILWLTFYKVIKKEDVNSSENVNMPAFKNAKVEYKTFKLFGYQITIAIRLLICFRLITKLLNNMKSIHLKHLIQQSIFMLFQKKEMLCF